MAQTLPETSMGHSNTGKSDPQPAPAKRGFFAAAGERLKRAMSGPPAADTAAPAVQDTEQPASADATASVQTKARDLLLQDRSSKRTRAAAKDSPLDAAAATPVARSRRTTPPPLPSQRTASEPSITEPEPTASSVVSAVPEAAQTSRSPKRPRDSKSEALRARLGAAKAALAQAQAMRATDPSVAAQAHEATATEPRATDTQPELTVTQSPDTLQPTAAEAVGGETAPTEPADGEPPEPIRTLTIARLLALQGYFARSLSIYDQLIAESADGNANELNAEAEQVRAQQAGKRKHSS